MISMRPGELINNRNISSRWKMLYFYRPHIIKTSHHRKACTETVHHRACGGVCDENSCIEEHSYTVQTRRAGIQLKLQHFFSNNNSKKKKKIYKVIAPFIKRHRWSENMQKDFTLFAAISISSRLFSSLIRQERFQTASWLQSLRKTYSDYTSAFNFGSLCHWLFTKSAIC